MLFDSHTHLKTESITDEEFAELIEEIEASNLSYAVDIGCDLESSMLAAKHAKEYDWCYAAVGYHPHEAKDMGDVELAMIESLAKKDKVKAIGEIGLDYYYDYSPRDVQIEVFRKQIQLANRLKMPIVVHSRDASQETMDILKEEGAFSDERKNFFPKRPDGSGDARVLIHCYSGSAQMASHYVKLGATISIAGPITFKNSRRLQEVVDVVPLEKLLVETDAPFLTPEPFRGKRNKTYYVEYVVRRVALLKNMEYEDVAKITLDNAKRFFDIND